MAKKKDTNKSQHAARKATQAYEEHEPGQKRTRKSTRSGTSHNKATNTLEIREQLTRNSPSARHDRDRSKRGPLRGR